MATILFLLLDYGAGINVRLSFLDDRPDARAAYYLFCFVCFGLMLWRPAWTELVGAFESLVTLVALILSFGLRTLLSSAAVLDGEAERVTIEQIINFLLVGSVAYIAWARGIHNLRYRKRREM